MQHLSFTLRLASCLLKLMLLSLPLVGCIGLETTDEVIPQAVRKPYLGHHLYLNERVESKALVWSNQKRSYVARDGTLFSIAPLKLVMPDFEESSSLGQRDYVVTVESSGSKARWVFFLQLTNSVKERGSYIHSVRGFFFKSDNFLSHVARYQCLRDHSPRGCLLQLFDPNSSMAIGTLKTSGHNSGESQPTELSGEKLWGATIDPRLPGPAILAARPGKWRAVLEYAAPVAPRSIGKLESAGLLSWVDYELFSD